MCGIAGFISKDNWKTDLSRAWWDGVAQEADARPTHLDEWMKYTAGLRKLADAFDAMMSFGFHYSLVCGGDSEAKMIGIADSLESNLERLNGYMAEKGRSDELDQLAELIQDCLWQIRHEVLANVGATTVIMPEPYRGAEGGRGRHFTAWAIELVMQNLDRLEVRGRDSAGVAIQLILPSDAVKALSLDLPPFSEKTQGPVRVNTRLTRDPKNNIVMTFLYKIANLVGRLGDNTTGLRQVILHDEMLWRAADLVENISVSAHTRWASNGIISLGNCHPVDGILAGADHAPSADDTGALFVLNGDVDNYKPLVNKYVLEQGYAIDPTVTTDAKILPVFYRLGTDLAAPPEQRIAQLVNSCEGSLAIVMQHPSYPRKLFLAQKGSGQSLFIGRLHDGLVIASEVYGLAAVTRSSYSLSGVEFGGSQVTIDADAPEGQEIVGRYFEDGRPFEPKPDQIYIHSRDIYRGAYDYYFEKEISEAPSSVRKTIKNKYRKAGSVVEFAVTGQDSFTRLITRMTDPTQPQIKRIMVIGQGTASIAAMGTAYLITRALAGARIPIDWNKSSELSGFLSSESLEDMLVVAISQSGTTTDTNRTVDLVGAQGAWVHSIVNRRNSPLVAKSNSHFYTSDGRDVEMAVASTKAFYSQIAAGKLLALLLAQIFKTMADDQILQEILELEKLPAHIEAVLSESDKIREIAEKFGPGSRNWAVVGNGPNKIAADEIRIKLSELCYKSIPCDFTEDKKHIDLSTEPLTLVVANDLPESIVVDTAKETAIFKAHNGQPIVIIARGETRFNEYALGLIETPTIGAGLGFVLATVAGHLLGFHIAKAIDSRAEELRNVRVALTRYLEQPETWDLEDTRTRLWAALTTISGGDMNASLPASTAAALALYTAGLTNAGVDFDSVIKDAAQGISIINKAVEEMTRPIDSIRHQAKTVTVGITRPQEILPPILLVALEALAIDPTQVREIDRRLLRLVSPIIEDVIGGLYYELTQVPGQGPWMRVARRMGFCVDKPSRYDMARSVGGSKRTALRLERSVWSAGPRGDENLLIAPIFQEDTAECVGIALFHLLFQKQASAAMKLTILKGLGSRYYELVERLEEVSSPTPVDVFLESVSPRDLILAPIDRLVPAKG